MNGSATGGRAVHGVQEARQAIDDALVELGALGWTSTVHALVENLASGCARVPSETWCLEWRGGDHDVVIEIPPFDEHHPAAEVLAVLRAIDAHAPEHVQLELFARRFARLGAFLGRARKTDRSGRPVLWNPLEESLAEFAADGGEVHRYRASAPYPPDDQIQAWVYTALARARAGHR